MHLFFKVANDVKLQLSIDKDRSAQSLTQTASLHCMHGPWIPVTGIQCVPTVCGVVQAMGRVAGKPLTQRPVSSVH